MATKAKRERERSLLPLRRLRARVEPVQHDLDVVAMRSHQRDRTVELLVAKPLERIAHTLIDIVDVGDGERGIAPVAAIRELDRGVAAAAQRTRAAK